MRIDAPLQLGLEFLDARLNGAHLRSAQGVDELHASEAGDLGTLALRNQAFAVPLDRGSQAKGMRQVGV